MCYHAWLCAIYVEPFLLKDILCQINSLALGAAIQKPETKDAQSKYETARDYKNHLKGVSQDRELEEWFQDCLRCMLVGISWHPDTTSFWSFCPLITLNHRAQLGRPNLLWKKMVTHWPSIGILGKEVVGEKGEGSNMGSRTKHIRAPIPRHPRTEWTNRSLPSLEIE